MGKLQHQPRPTLACWTPPTFSPMHSSCSSVGKIFPCVILLSIYIYLYSFTFLKVCGREDEFALLLELGHDIQVSNEIKFLSKLWLFIPSGISTWLFGFSYVVGIHSLWYLLIVQVGENLQIYCQSEKKFWQLFSDYYWVLPSHWLAWSGQRDGQLVWKGKFSPNNCLLVDIPNDFRFVGPSRIDNGPLELAYKPWKHFWQPYCWSLCSGDHHPCVIFILGDLFLFSTIGVYPSQFLAW